MEKKPNVYMNGQAGPAKPAEKEAPPGPFAFVDDFPSKVRALVQGAVEAAQADSRKVADRRYVEGLRRGVFLISLAVSGLDPAARQQLARALEQLEAELSTEEAKLRTP